MVILLHVKTFYFELVLLVSNRDIVLFNAITTLVHSRSSPVHHKLHFPCRHLKVMQPLNPYSRCFVNTLEECQ